MVSAAKLSFESIRAYFRFTTMEVSNGGRFLRVFLHGNGTLSSFELSQKMQNWTWQVQCLRFHAKDSMVSARIVFIVFALTGWMGWLVGLLDG